MKKISAIIFLILAAAIGVNAQVQTFVKKIEDQSSLVLNATVQAADGNFVLLATAFTGAGTGSQDLLLVKIDTGGNALWSRTYNTVSGDLAQSIKTTKDGGFIISGYIGTPGLNDAFLLKLDSTGGVQWSKTYASAASDYGRSVETLEDGGYALLISGGPTKILRLDASGNIMWNREYPLPGFTVPAALKRAGDGGFMLVMNESGIGKGTKMVRLDSLGNAKWVKDYAPASTQWIFDFVETTDGGWLMAGTPGVLFKTDSLGSLEWSKHFDTIGEINYIAKADGGYYLAGMGRFGINSLIASFLMKIDTAGLPLLSVAHFPTYNNGAGGVYPLGDTGYIMFGTDKAYTRAEKRSLLITKMDAAGFSGCSDRAFQASWSNLLLTQSPVTLVSNPTTMTAAPITTLTGPGVTMSWICPPLSIDDPYQQKVELRVSPNPSSGKVLFEADMPIESVLVLNARGETVMSQATKGSRVTVDLSNQSAGLYFYLVKMKSGQKTGRVVVL